MMKKIFVVLLLLVSGYVMAQPSNYVPYQSRNRYIALMADSTFHIPRFNGSPSLRTGGSSQDGALAADTANGRLYMYYNGSWGLVNKDTANTFLNSLYKKTGTDSIFQIKGGTHSFVFTVGSGSGSSSDSSTLFVDTTYNRLAHQISTDSLMLKSLRVQLNGSDITPTSTDSTLSWNIQALVAADTSNKYVTAVYRKTASDSVFYVKGGTHTFAYKDSIGSGGGGSPAGNYGNVQLNRNGAFATPASDSLNFSAGLAIKGTLSATALPTGGVAADSVVVVSSAGALKKRNSSAFVTTNGSTATGQLALFNGSGTVYSSSRFVYNDASYPYMGIIGSDPILYFGAVSNNNPIVGSGSGLSLYGGDTYESINFQTKITGGQQMARFYSSATNIFWHTFNGNIIASTTYSPSLEQGAYTVQRTVPYTTNVNTHGFTDETNFNSQSAAFNSFGSFVKFGNNRNTQDHYASFQSVWRKDSTNTVNDVYDFIAGTSTITGGTIDSMFRFRVFPVNITAGAINVEYGLYMPAGSATTKYGAYIEDNVGIGTNAPSEKLHVNGAIKTATSGSGSGAWKLGVAVSSSGLTLVTDQYVEISIGGTVYKLALVNAP